MARRLTRAQRHAITEITAALQATASPGGGHAATEVARATAVAALRRLGVEHLSARVLTRPDAMTLPAVVGLGPVARRVSAAAPAYRAAYLVAAGTRLAHRRGLDELTGLARERRYFAAHQAAQTERVQAATRLDAAAGAYGARLGWYARHDERTTPECAAADGHNFSPAAPPSIGLPGLGPHRGCRCVAGPAHAGAASVDEALGHHHIAASAPAATTDEVIELSSVDLSAKTPRLASVHHPLGRPGGPGLFRRKGNMLPAYVENVARAIMRGGVPKSRAIAIALARIRDWAEGRGHVSPEVRAASIKAIAEWDAERAAARARPNKGHSHAADPAAAPVELSALELGWRAWLHPRDRHGRFTDRPGIGGERHRARASVTNLEARPARVSGYDAAAGHRVDIGTLPVAARLHRSQIPARTAPEHRLPAQRIPPRLRPAVRRLDALPAPDPATARAGLEAQFDAEQAHLHAHSHIEVRRSGHALYTRIIAGVALTAALGGFVGENFGTETEHHHEPVSVTAVAHAESGPHFPLNERGAIEIPAERGPSVPKFEGPHHSASLEEETNAAAVTGRKRRTRLGEAEPPPLASGQRTRRTGPANAFVIIK